MVLNEIKCEFGVDLNHISIPRKERELGPESIFGAALFWEEYAILPSDVTPHSQSKKKTSGELPVIITNSNHA